MDDLVYNFVQSQAAIQREYIKSLEKIKPQLSRRDFDLEASYRSFGYPWARRKAQASSISKLFPVVPINNDEEMRPKSAPLRLKPGARVEFEGDQFLKRNLPNVQPSPKKKVLTQAEIDAFHERNRVAVTKKYEQLHQIKNALPSTKISEADVEASWRAFYNRNHLAVERKNAIITEKNKKDLLEAQHEKKKQSSGYLEWLIKDTEKKVKQKIVGAYLSQHCNINWRPDKLPSSTFRPRKKKAKSHNSMPSFTTTSRLMLSTEYQQDHFQALPSEAFILWKSLQLMGEGDVGLSIEYCCNCQNHQTTTLHDESKYYSVAMDCKNNLMKTLSNYNVRLLVDMLPISVWNDEDGGHSMLLSDNEEDDEETHEYNKQIYGTKSAKPKWANHFRKVRYAERLFHYCFYVSTTFNHPYLSWLQLIRSK